MGILSFISIIIYMLAPPVKVAIAVDSIHLSHTISDGMTLVSKGGAFELGFFSPGNSNKRYLGIWYKNIPVQTVVWVANRLSPINDSFGILTLNDTSNLVLSQNGNVVWYTSLHKQAQKPVAELLDSGNLVIRDENEANPESYLWQSFDYPSDTWLPEMKFGWDLRKGLKWELTAWKSPDDPAPGDFACVAGHSNYPDSYLMKAGNKYSRFGPWNGLRPSGAPEAKANSIYYFKFVYNKDEMYYTYYLKNNSIYSRSVLNQTDYTRYRYVWVEAEQNWEVFKSKPLDHCDYYGLCGAHGNCIINESPVCQCLKGFSPKSPQNWNSMDWSQGCVRNKPLNCTNESRDGFLRFVGLKVPDTTNTWLDENMGLEECRLKCLKNCSCMAYTNSDIRGQGSGCAMWFDDLIDIRQFPVGGQDLYIRMASSELEEAENGHRRRLKATLVTTAIAAVFGILLVGCCIIYRVRRNLTEKSKSKDQNIEGFDSSEEDLDLLLFDQSTIISATNNFSMQNKIGQGGFGSVYKGRLVNGKEIAIKRLSKNSTQGMTEFKNEVKLIAKLQHRNLVKLLGCCIQGQEKVLVYEYMPNSSLDSFIFDFGMAKIFGGEQTEGNTNRVVGTYGYMAPEYAADGLFSIKFDIFSFGILVMETIYGKKNKGFYHADQTHNLIGHAWILWKEGRALELIDKNIEDSCIVSKAMRCLHVSLLCTQQHPEDRPTMSSVVLMLGSEVELAEPKQPGFFQGKVSFEENPSSSKMQSSSTNGISMTLLEAR